MKKLLVILLFFAPACSLLDNGIVIDRAVFITFDKYGDIIDSTRYNKNVAMEIDVENRCIKIESFVSKGTVRCYSNLEYDAEQSETIRRSLIGTKREGELIYVFGAKFEDYPYAETMVGMQLVRRYSDKMAEVCLIRGVFKFADGTEEIVIYKVADKSLKKFDEALFEQLTTMN